MRRRLAPVTAPAPNIWPPLLRCGGVDSWHANGPFLETVVEELGWPIIAVLKQERYESHQETLALTRGQQPTLVVARDGREVQIGDVRSVRFTDAYPGPVRVVRVRERWTERRRVGAAWKTGRLNNSGRQPTRPARAGRPSFLSRPRNRNSRSRTAARSKNQIPASARNPDHLATLRNR